MSHVLVPMIFTSVPGAMPEPDAAQVRVERADRHRNARRQAGALGPFRRQPARPPGQCCAPLAAAATRSSPSFGSSCAEELRVRVAAPRVVIHRLVAGGADADGQLVRRLGAGEHGGNPIGAFHPQVRGVEHLRAGAQAVQNLAEEPFAGIRAAALGQILRPHLARQRGDLAGLGDAGVVLPQPGHRGGILGEPAVERQRLAVAVHRQRRAAGGVHADADDLVRREAAHRFLRRRQRLLDGDLRARDVIGRMLPREVRVARQDDPLRAVRVVPDRGRHLAPVGDVDDQGADGVGAVIEADGVLGSAHGPVT